jgi:hypothetical protein
MPLAALLQCCGSQDAALLQSSGSQDVFGQLLALGSVWFDNPLGSIHLLFVFGWTWEETEPLLTGNIRLDAEQLCSSKTIGVSGSARPRPSLSCTVLVPSPISPRSPPLVSFAQRSPITQLDLSLLSDGFREKQRPLDAVEMWWVASSDTFKEDVIESDPVHKSVPMLIHNWKPMCETQIILQYIDEVIAGIGRTLLPTNPYDCVCCLLLGRLH